VIHDAYDAGAFAQTLELSPRLKSARHDAVQRLATAAALVEDVFYSLYQPAPTLRPPEELPLAALVNRAIVEQLVATSEWDALRRAGTIGDQLCSAIATATVCRSVIAALDQATLVRLGELADAEKAANKLFEEAEALDDVAAQKGDRAADLHARARAAHQRAQHRQQKAAEVAAELDADAEAIEDATRRAGRAGLQTAEREIDQLVAAVKTFTGGYATDASATDGAPILTLREKLGLASQVGRSARLKQVAELCGRLTRIALQVQRSRVRHPPDEIVGITMGNDLARMLPIELALLADPLLEDLWHRKYVDKRLMQLEMVGSERQGRGPVIIALDSSASMSEPLGSHVCKEAWSKAVALAVLAIARKQRRDVAILHFSGAGQIKAYVFPEGQAAPADLIATTEWFFEGGTVYDGWMAEALRLVDSSRFDRADVLCVSDGEVHIDAKLEEDWKRRRLRRGMRCYSVLLGDDTGAAVLARISDALATVTDLTDDNQALQVLFGF
jgi:uncharacterized protein with von Willebrand factor type A (vWA) domain